MTQDFREKIKDLPQHVVSGRSLHDLEMILNGGFKPLSGFLTEEDYNSVVKDMRLASGELWPIPIVLDVSEEEASAIETGSKLVLTDEYARPLAIMTVESKYTPDKKKEALGIYGTDDDTHFGVRYIHENMGPVYLGGPLEKIALPVRHDFKEYRKTPDEMKRWFADQGWDKVVAFQTRNPIHRAHFELLKRAGEEHGAKVLINPVVGETKDGDIDAFTRIRTYKKIIDHHAKDFATLNLLPLAMRMAGPREALWHALIRKNYGCTHFIVGRDHAGPGSDKNGNPFYDAQAAANLAKEYESELGIIIHASGNIAYVPKEDKYFTEDELEQHHETMNISGTQVRAKLRAGEDLPAWFSFPEVVAELHKTALKTKDQGYTIFFTGLSGSGKSTIAGLLQSTFMEIQTRAITMLDGDIVRTHLSKGLGFSREDRDANVRRIGFVAGEATKHGGIAICAAIAPYTSTRRQVRRSVEAFGPFIEVHIATPIETCEQRDVKGLYKKAKEGIIKGFTGVDDPYEVPMHPEITIDTTDIEPEEAVEFILEYLQENNLLEK